ncbi:hypothetical protein PENFLA_c006G10653 [Penicillium flavigenum]|uniref:Terpene synthase n=1 Tax=Penicillium flavigenum TaxID=254877 RepID=A0A1V6TLM5_9EURO|nr:hypothetical protein PENFLA_c006G10653 [Penicillium flavigenum]
MPMYLRTKIGGAEILLHLLFPNSVFPEEEYVMQYFPVTLELVLAIDFTNDILSYYKEFYVGDEQGLFIANLADTHHVQHLDILQYLTNYTPGSIAPRCSEEFHPGNDYAIHSDRRYHLVELFEDEQYLLPYDADA